MTGKSPCPRRKALNLALIAFNPAFQDHPCIYIYTTSNGSRKNWVVRGRTLPAGWNFALNIYTKTNTNSGMLNLAAVVGIFQQFVTNLGFFLVHWTSAPVCSLPTSPPRKTTSWICSLPLILCSLVLSCCRLLVPRLIKHCQTTPGASNSKLKTVWKAWWLC